MLLFRVQFLVRLNWTSLKRLSVLIRSSPFFHRRWPDC